MLGTKVNLFQNATISEPLFNHLSEPPANPFSVPSFTDGYQNEVPQGAYHQVPIPDAIREERKFSAEEYIIQLNKGILAITKTCQELESDLEAIDFQSLIHEEYEDVLKYIDNIILALEHDLLEAELTAISTFAAFSSFEKEGLKFSPRVREQVTRIREKEAENIDVIRKCIAKSTQLKSESQSKRPSNSRDNWQFNEYRPSKNSEANSKKQEKLEEPQPTAKAKKTNQVKVKAR